MRPAAVLLIVLTSCRAVVDAGVTYEPCARSPLSEPFAVGSSLDDLYPRCWQIDDPNGDVGVDDGDLILRSSEPAGDVPAQWNETTQGPLVWQRFEGNFIFATRVEVLDKVNADHCLTNDNVAGLAVRRGDEWATLMIGPLTPATPPPGFGCDNAAKVQPAAYALLRSNAWGPEHRENGLNDAGIGEDAEADLVACRSDESLAFYYRDPASTEAAPKWLKLGGDLEYDVGKGPLDVGLSVAGRRDESDETKSFRVAGHFQWAWLSDDLGPDFCQSALERIAFPTVE